MRCLLGQENSIDIDALPYGPDDEQVPAGIETIVAAETVRPARGRILEEIIIKREDGGRDREREIIEVKEEPSE